MDLIRENDVAYYDSLTTLESERDPNDDEGQPGTALPLIDHSLFPSVDVSGYKQPAGNMRGPELPVTSTGHMSGGGGGTVFHEGEGAVHGGQGGLSSSDHDSSGHSYGRDATGVGVGRPTAAGASEGGGNEPRAPGAKATSGKAGGEGGGEAGGEGLLLGPPRRMGGGGGGGRGHRADAEL